MTYIRLRSLILYGLAHYTVLVGTTFPQQARAETAYRGTFPSVGDPESPRAGSNTAGASGSLLQASGSVVGSGNNATSGAATERDSANGGTVEGVEQGRSNASAAGPEMPSGARETSGWRGEGASSGDTTGGLSAGSGTVIPAGAGANTPTATERSGEGSRAPLVEPEVLYHQSDSDQPREPKQTSSPFRVYSHPSAVTALAFDTSGKILASGDADGLIRLWPLGSEELVSTLEAHRRGVRTLSFHPDGVTLASGGGDSMVHVWNTRELRAQAWLDFKAKAPINVVAFSGDGTRILSAGQDDSILVRDVVTGQKLPTFFGHSAAVTAVVTSPSEDCVISGGRDRSLQGWDLSSAEQLDFSTQPGWVTALALSKDGNRLATALSNGLVTLRRTTSCRVQTVALRLDYHSQAVRAVVFSPDGRFLFSAGDDRQIVKWDVESGLPLEVFQGHQGPINSLAVTRDGALLASAGNDKVVRIWKLAPTDAFERPVVAPSAPVPSRAISTRPWTPPRPATPPRSGS